MLASTYGQLYFLFWPEHQPTARNTFFLARASTYGKLYLIFLQNYIERRPEFEIYACQHQPTAQTEEM
jgi:hypothetical protein